ncbi:MAG TPA: decaprenyl-phosphate phosphoribosyltransferase [Bacteroidia bacterium]|nr:decaprenyl-phosphate phosphoribosyltransferase [Bacteroidia bacterium]
MKDYISLARLPQWVKNVFIFLPVFFAGKVFDFALLSELATGFITFSLASGSIYTINDLADKSADAKHPSKKNRPLASGRISPSQAIIFAAALGITALMLSLWLDRIFFRVIGIYIAINIFYSFLLKHIPVLDIIVVSSGFLLRIFAGGILADVPISHWIVIMTFLLSLFLALAKRRDDVLIFNESGEKMRKSVDGYNLEFINAAMMVMAAVIVVSYIMYTLSEVVMQRIGSREIYFTTIFVIAGLLRYLQISFVENNSGSPTHILLRDRFIQLTILGWLVSFFLLLYHGQ